MSGLTAHGTDFAASGVAIDGLVEAGAGDFGAGLANALGDQVGGIAGRLLGGLAGSVLGPAGAAIGQQLGARIGEQAAGQITEHLSHAFRNIDAAALSGTLTQVSQAVADTALDIDKTWLRLKADFADAVAGITTALRGLDFKGLLGGSAADAGEKVSGAVGGITGKLSGLADQTLARVADAIDGAFGRFQEPLAQAADLLQGVGVKLGLVSADAESWGDTVREASDIGTQALELLAEVVGTVIDLFRAEAGYLQTLIGLYEAAAGVVGTVLAGAWRGWLGRWRRSRPWPRTWLGRCPTPCPGWPPS